MWKHLKKYWYWCLIAPLFMVGEVLMDLFQPDMMADIVDNGVLAGNLSVVVSVGIKMILLVIFGGFCGVMSGVFANFASQRFGNDLRKDVFSKIMDLSFEQTDKISTGSLVTRLSNDATQVQNMVMMAVRGIVRSGVMFVGGIIMLYAQSPQFAFVAACGLPFVIVLVTFFMKKATPMFSIVQKKLDGVNNVMQEDVAGARVVKAYVREDYEIDRFGKANDDLCRVNLKVATLLAYMSPCMNIVLNLCVVAVIFVGGINVSTGGQTTPGEIMAAITYISLILSGVMFLASIFQTFTRAKASVDRINEVLHSSQTVVDGSFDGQTDIKGEIELSHVSFGYPGTGTTVLEDINLSVKRGQTLAILGSTGCGKSSLVDLIPRFYDCTTGEVTVDGVNVKDYQPKALRDKISIVMQKTELYSRSIEENIRWGNPEATEWDIKRAAQVAQADEFICQTPYGYYTQVSEGGHSLSGGQKQRISIARAVLKGAEILIFDDSTSALDLQTEAKLYKALRESCPDTTKIIIAQRISSVKDADEIAVVDNGRICAVGTHAQLMKTSDVYRDIYDSQLKEGADNE